MTAWEEMSAREKWKAAWQHLPEAARQIGWGLSWSLGSGLVLDLLFGDQVWHVAVTTLAMLAGFTMARHRSLRWRWLLIKHRDELDRPFVFNEDEQLHTGIVLPFEEVHAIWSVETHRPVAAHIHTRDLLGRSRVRSITDWPE